MRISSSPSRRSTVAATLFRLSSYERPLVILSGSARPPLSPATTGELGDVHGERLGGERDALGDRQVRVPLLPSGA